MPRLLTGWLPSTEGAQRIMDKIKAGQMNAVKREVTELDRLINRSAGIVDKGNIDERTQTN